MNESIASNYSSFLNALHSLKKARLVTRAFNTNDHEFEGLTDEEQLKLKNSITPFFNTIFEIEDRVLEWYRNFHPELSNDEDLIESIRKEFNYETLIYEKGKISIEKLIKDI